jgi:threonine synthase
MYKIIDFLTKDEVQTDTLVFTGDKNPWEIVIDLDEVQRNVNIDYFKKAPPQVSKYLPFLPVKSFSNFISMNEGATPLIRSRHVGKLLGIDLYFKCEYQNPTGSFKDRGSAVELTVAKELNAKAIAVASTGNMAASCSCYAANAGIPCFVFVPEDTPTSKLSQAISYGGKIVQVKGTYNDAAVLAENVAKSEGFYLAGDYAFRVEGQKTAAFELIDQLFFQVPDAVIIPIGCGTNLAGYAKGFNEYKALGLIDTIPKIIGVQAEGSKSVVNSFEKGSMEIEALPRLDTIASAISVKNPIDGVKALEGIYKSSGQAVAVSDSEILEALYILSSQEGLFVEASSATALASLIKLVKQGMQFKGRVICVLTGEGLKDPATILKIAIKPPTISPTTEEFTSLYSNSFFEGKSISFLNRDKVIFSKTPDEHDLRNFLDEHFKGKYSRSGFSRIHKIIEKFLKKGKPVTFSDMQDIVQDVLETSNKDIKLKVLDFKVNTGKDIVPHAAVEIELNGERKFSEGQGVGPVDAVINALKTACVEDMNFALSNFEVVIRSKGTDAVVYAEIKLLREGKVSIGRGVSPDVIQASIEAFEIALNGL